MTDEKQKEIKAKEPDFWDAEESEELTYETLDEAVEGYLDQANIWLDDPTIDIIVSGFCKMEISRETLNPLDNLLDQVEEEYGNPNKDYKPTDALREAEKKFIDIFLQEYDVYVCEKVCEVSVNVKEWVEENRPDWLEKKADMGSKDG